jgi:hypothetical protein
LKRTPRTDRNRTSSPSQIAEKTLSEMWRSRGGGLGFGLRNPPIGQTAAQLLGNQGSRRWGPMTLDAK